MTTKSKEDEGKDMKYDMSACARVRRVCDISTHPGISIPNGILCLIFIDLSISLLNVLTCSQVHFIIVKKLIVSQG